MARLLGLLLVCAGLALAQEKQDDDSGISVDEVPEGPEQEEAKPGSKPAEQRTTAFPAREPGKKVETVEVRKKPYSFSVPADWVLLEERITNDEIYFELLLPGSSKRGGFWLVRRERADPRSWPYYQAEWFRKERPDRKVEVRPSPCPRAIVRWVQEGTEWIEAYFCLSAKNNFFFFQISCAAADFPQAEADLLATVRTFKAEVELWPPIPKGYETTQEGIWLVAKAPAVTASIAPLMKTLKDTEKRFRREHGPLPKSDAPLVVLVHASKAQGAKIDPAVGDRTIDFHADSWARRIFAIPFPKENMDQATMLAGEVADLLFLAKYGDTRPAWIWVGEVVAASAECRTGKPLPSLDEGYLAWYSTIKFHGVSELEALRKSDAETWSRESFFYVAALREGKYRKQYKAFLADYAETADGLGAFERHLATIGEADLIEATDNYIRTRIKEEKRKHDH
ncbi:MAG: hypothetical protein L6Q95_06210 [Planctomycetes bacterium]|nr:hypothetical protein [Planctomycetota bacterium]